MTITCDINNCNNNNVKTYCLCDTNLCPEHKLQRIGRMVCPICQYGHNLCPICNSLYSFNCLCKGSALIAHNNIIKATAFYTDICLDIIRYEWELYKRAIIDSNDDPMNETFYQKYNEIYNQKEIIKLTHEKNIQRKRNRTV